MELVKTAALFLLILLLSLPGFGAQRKKRHVVHGKKSGVHTAGKVRASNKVKASKTLKGKRTVRPARAAKPVQGWRTGQMTPTPERYKEIQGALAAKGYSSQPPDGVWDQQWTDSLKRFQQDQKLEPSGKLNSLSLITLGLGPKREANAFPAASANGSPESVTRELP